MVKTALWEMDYLGLMVTEVKGRGNQKGISEVWCGTKYQVDLLSKIKIEISVSDADVKKIVCMINNEFLTGSIEDGKLFIYDVENVYRILTREFGEGFL